MHYSIATLSIFLIQIQLIQCYDPTAWKSAADYLLDALDTTADPCKNFYQYACGNWMKKYNGTFESEMDKSMEENQIRILKAIQEIRTDDPSTPRYHRMVKSLYDQCMRATEQESNPILGIYNYTKNIIGPMPILDPGGVRKQNPYHLIGLIKRLLGADVLIQMDLHLVQEGCHMMPLIKLDRASTYFSLSETNYTYKFMDLGAANGVNLNETEVSEKISKILDKDPHRLSELSQINSNISWDQYFSGLIAERIFVQWKARDPKIIIQAVSYLKQIDKIIEKLGYDDLVNLAYLSIFNHYLQQEWEKKESEAVMGKKNQTAEIRCVEYVQTYASAAAARLLFENIGRKGDTKLITRLKRDLDVLVESVLAASRYLIHTAEWLDSEDKAAVVDKINSMAHHSAIPDWILDDAAVVRHTPEYNLNLTLFENQLRISLQRFEWKMESLMNAAGLPPKALKHDFLTDILIAQLVGEPDFSWNAFYAANSLNLQLGLVSPPFYNYSYPMAMKFSEVGWVVAHELFHGFDYEGTLEGRFDTVKRWLKPRALIDFKKRSKCIMKQYSGYCDKRNNYCISGQRNIDENIADMDGIKIAYMAYKFTMQTTGVEPRLPGLEHLTPDQIFFLSAGRLWCSTGKKDYDWFKLGDTHSPPKARAELPMMNFPAFAQAFKCKMGTKFAPLHTCSLWGDFLEPKSYEKSSN